MKVIIMNQTKAELIAYFKKYAIDVSRNKDIADCDSFAIVDAYPRLSYYTFNDVGGDEYSGDFYITHVNLEQMRGIAAEAEKCGVDIKIPLVSNEEFFIVRIENGEIVAVKEN